jgi:hypothetical protein
MSDGWGEASGIASNYEDTEEEPEPEPETESGSSESAQHPGSRVETSTSERSTTTTCQANTRDNTQCQNTALDGSDYCKKHTPNTAGELTWTFERVQMHMSEENREELSRLKKQIELDETLDMAKKEFENTCVELIIEDESVQDALAELCTRKYAEE